MPWTPKAGGLWIRDRARFYLPNPHPKRRLRHAPTWSKGVQRRNYSRAKHPI